MKKSVKTPERNLLFLGIFITAIVFGAGLNINIGNVNVNAAKNNFTDVLAKNAFPQQKNESVKSR